MAINPGTKVSLLFFRLLKLSFTFLEYEMTACVKASKVFHDKEAAELTDGPGRPGKPLSPRWPGRPTIPR